MIKNFDPIIVGGFLPADELSNLSQFRIGRRRRYSRTLKNDPFIFSFRFQNIPTIYFLDDHSIIMRRMLKYTPEHTHCYATFYGPVTLPSTGFCALNSLSADTGFKVTATGEELETQVDGCTVQDFQGHGFIKDMFSSALEVAKLKEVMSELFWD